MGIYRLLFAWWLEQLIARRSQAHLKNTIRRDLAFLFADREARFVPNDRVYRWGQVVSLQVGDILFRIGRDRGQDFVDVAPKQAPADWEQISIALMATQAGMADATMENLPPYPSFLLLSELAPLLKPRFADLAQAYSPDRYPATKRMLEAMHAVPQYGRFGMLIQEAPASGGARPGGILGL